MVMGQSVSLNVKASLEFENYEFIPDDYTISVTVSSASVELSREGEFIGFITCYIGQRSDLPIKVVLTGGSDESVVQADIDRIVFSLLKDTHPFIYLSGHDDYDYMNEYIVSVAEAFVETEDFLEDQAKAVSDYAAGKAIFL